MRLYINLITGAVSAELPAKPGECHQRVKSMSGEPLELRFLEDGVAGLLATGSSLKISVRDAPGGTLLAEQTTFNAPVSANVGFYTAVMSFNTTNVLALLEAAPTKDSFAVVGEVSWLIPGEDDWHVSATINLALLRRVGAGIDPVVLVSPYSWLKDTLIAGDGITLTHDDEAKTITVVAAGDALKLDASARGAANGVAPLDSSSKVPAANLPSYVDDVVEAANFAALPSTGETGKIYVTLDTNYTYRWSGSVYVQIDGPPDFASQVEAEAGTDNAKVMTPLRTAQAIGHLRGNAQGLAPLDSTSKVPAYNLPPPADSETLGCVMRNAGSGGQFVTGIGSDGSLQFGTPAGGGTIVRASATLQGSTSADIPATAPSALNIYVNSATAVTFGVSATDYGTPILSANFTINYTDPSDGSYFIDLNVYGDTYSIAGAIYSILNGLVGGPLSVSVSGQTVTFQTISTGSSTSLSGGAIDSSIISIWGGGSGTDDIPASGQISYAKIFGYVSGKVIRPLAVWGVSADLGEVVNVIDDYDGQNIVPALGETGGVLNAMPPDISTIAKFMRACKGNIYAYVGSTASGGGATIYMIAELIDVPAYGTFQYYTCIGLTYVAVYADGAGGSYNVTIESNSTSCGYGS